MGIFCRICSPASDLAMEITSWAARIIRLPDFRAVAHFLPTNRDNAENLSKTLASSMKNTLLGEDSDCLEAAIYALIPNTSASLSDCRLVSAKVINLESVWKVEGLQIASPIAL